MEYRKANEDIDLLMERLVRVENALFCLKVKAKCLSCSEELEVERLEQLRHELHQSYERIYSQEMAATS